MGRDHRSLKVTLFLALLAAGLAACSDDGARSVGPTATSTPGTPHTSRVTLYCTATVRPANAVCRPVGKGAGSMDSRMRRYVVVGKQGVYVNLSVSNFVFKSDTFSFSATVQNLMGQPLGTQNGTTLAGTGVDVFFTAGPSSETGTGTVTPVGTSTGTFTASGQQYYEYAQVIKPDSTSAALTWKFFLTPQVTAFNFFVEVAGDMPAEGSVYRWTPIHLGVTNNSLTSAWQDASTDVFAVGLSGTVLHYDGTTWSALALNQPTDQLRGISGSSSTDVWMVGDNSVTVHYNGSTFTTVSVPTAANFKSVYELASNHVYAVGISTVSILEEYNGTSWVNIAAPHGVVDTLYGVWAADSNHVFAVGSGGRLLEWSGAAWTQFAKPTGTPSFRSVWGTSATNVYAVATNGAVYHFNGTAWSAMTSPTTNELDAIGGTSASNIWAVGVNGTTINYNGTSWSVVGPAETFNLHGVTSGSATPTWAVGDNGTLLSLNGTTETLSSQSGLPIYRIWAASDTSVWATSIGMILHYNGTSWSTVYVSTTAADTMLGLWGFNPQDVHTLTVNGNVVKWNGTTWTPTAFGGTSWRAEWGDEADTNLLCAASKQGTIYCNDVQNYATAGTTQLMSMWGTSTKVLYTSNVNGVIYQSTDSGTTFHAMTSNTTDSVFAIWGTSTTQIFAAGENGTVLTNTGGTSWTAQSSGTTNDLRWLWADTPPAGYTADVYAVGDQGTIQHYNGTAWTAMSSGVTTALRCVYGAATTNLYISGDNGVVLVGSQ